MKQYSKYLSFVISLIIAKIIFDLINRLLISINILNLKYYNIGLNIILPETTSITTFRILSLITALPLIYVVFQLIAFRKISKKLEKNIIFTNESGTNLNLVANGFLFFTLLVGVTKVFIEAYLNYINNHTTGRITRLIGTAIGESIIDTIFYILPILVATIFIKIIAKLLIDGSLIKQENDLTI
tara:strand:+ start:184 stop:738 length:555 start_codon:yes stop_codon:yes gene_type:complete